MEQDNSEEQEARPARGVNQTLISLMLEHATDGLALVASDGTVLATTPAIDRMLGNVEGSLVGHSGLDIIHPEDLSRALDRLAHISENYPEDYQSFRCRHADGHWVTVDLLATENPEPIPEAPGGSLVLTVRDLTEFYETRLTLERTRIRHEILAALAASLVNAQGSEIDDQINGALETIGSHINVDRVQLYRTSSDFETMRQTHRWGRGDLSFLDNLNLEVPTSTFPAWIRSIERLDIVALEDIQSLDPSQHSERAGLLRSGITALLAVPMTRDGTATGFLVVAVSSGSRAWNDDDTGLLQVATDIIGAALARQDGSEESRLAESRFRALVEQSTDAIVVIDSEGRITQMPIGQNLWGHTPEALYDTNALDLVHPDDLDFAVEELIKAALDPSYKATNPMRIRHADGHWVPIELVASSRFDEPSINGIIMNVRDVSERHETEAALRATDKRLQTLIDNVPGAVFRCEVAAPFRELFISDEIETLTGYRPEVLLRHEVNLYDLILPDHLDYVERVISEAVQQGKPYRLEYQHRHRDGTLRWVEERGQVVLSPTGVPAWIDGVMLDLTDRKRLEQRLTYDAAHDPLTGLPNRSMLMSHLETTLARGARTDSITAALFIDLDRFKLVNDALGHAAGDELLVHFTRRLQSALRTSDLATRSGGDEFVIVCSDLAAASEAEVVAGRIATILRDPFTIRGRTVFVSASIGIALADRNSDAGQMLRNADAAAYRAKDLGRNRYEVFDDEMRAATAAALEIETDLHRALDRRQLLLRYQPFVALESGIMTGVEGLVRWQHPERGLLNPDEFLPAAEASGLIVALGRQVLELAVGAMSGLTEEEIATIAMNLSPRELAQPDLVKAIEQCLTENSVAPHRLCIEITESAVLDDVDATIATLESLREIGVRLAIDDFGTGYSSLSHLRRLPVDIVKIDKSFIAELGADGANLTIVAGIIGLARGLGLEVIAEGIETRRQLDVLHELGCTFGQGYLFSAPVALDDLLGADFPKAAPREVRH